MRLTPRMIVRELDRAVIGQMEAKRSLATAACAQVTRAMRLASGERPGDLPPKQNVLVVGPTGSGKTMLVETLAGILDTPFSAVDATRLDANRVQDLLVGLAQKAPNDREKIEAGIIYIDEIDKLRDTGEPASRGLALQQAILKLLEAGEITLNLGGHLKQVSTANILFIASGAFVGLEQLIAHRVGRGGQTLGFNVPDGDGQPAPARLFRELTTHDLVRFGMIPEFIGRFPVKATLDELNEQDFVNILRHSSQSPLRFAKDQFRWHGIALEVTQDALEAIAQLALKAGTGARGLAECFRRVVEPLEFDMPELADLGFGKVVIDRPVVLGESEPLRIKSPAASPLCHAPRVADKDSREHAEIRRLFPDGMLPRRPARAPGGAHGSARWANEGDLARWLTSSGTPGETSLPHCTILVENAPDGSALLPRLDQTLYFSDEDRRRHLLAVGKTGSGKTSRFIIPLLASDLRDPDRSLVVVDAQLDLAPKIVALTRSIRGPNAKLIYINPLDAEHSACWNPLQAVRSRSDAAQIAMIITNSIEQARGDSPYFQQEAFKNLTQLILAILAESPGTANMAMLHRALEIGAPELERLGGVIQSGILTTFAQEVQRGGSNAVTTLSTMTNALAPWDDDSVCATTSCEEFSYSQLDQEPCVLIYAMPEESVRRLLPCTNCFVQGLFDYVKARRGRQRMRTISLIIDEFASAVGRLQDLDISVNTLRKRGLALTAAVQQLWQIQSTYGASYRQVQESFNTAMFLPPLDPEDAAVAAKLSHMTTVQEIHTSDGVTPSHVASQPRYVLSEGDVNALEPHPELGPRVTVCLPETYRFQAYLKPYYEDPELQDMLSDETRCDIPRRQSPISWERLRRTPIVAAPRPGQLPPGITNTAGWTEQQLRDKLEEVKLALDWERTTGSARSWWLAFERENLHRLALVLRLAEELKNRQATVTEFFLAYIYSRTDNIQANLHYLDYTRLKQEEERRKRSGPSRQDGDPEPDGDQPSPP